MLSQGLCAVLTYFRTGCLLSSPAFAPFVCCPSRSTRSSLSASTQQCLVSEAQPLQAHSLCTSHACLLSFPLDSQFPVGWEIHKPLIWGPIQLVAYTIGSVRPELSQQLMGEMVAQIQGKESAQPAQHVDLVQFHSVDMSEGVGGGGGKVGGRAGEF
jgi:hypothetical protein